MPRKRALPTLRLPKIRWIGEQELSPHLAVSCVTFLDTKQEPERRTKQEQEQHLQNNLLSSSTNHRVNTGKFLSAQILFVGRPTDFSNYESSLSSVPTSGDAFGAIQLEQNHSDCLPSIPILSTNPSLPFVPPHYTQKRSAIMIGDLVRMRSMPSLEFLLFGLKYCTKSIPHDPAPKLSTQDSTHVRFCEKLRYLFWFVFSLRYVLLEFSQVVFLEDPPPSQPHSFTLVAPHRC